MVKRITPTDVNLGTRYVVLPSIQGSTFCETRNCMLRACIWDAERPRSMRR